ARSSTSSATFPHRPTWCRDTGFTLKTDSGVAFTGRSPLEYRDSLTRSAYCREDGSQSICFTVSSRCSDCWCLSYERNRICVAVRRSGPGYCAGAAFCGMDHTMPSLDAKPVQSAADPAISHAAQALQQGCGPGRKCIPLIPHGTVCVVCHDGARGGCHSFCGHRPPLCACRGCHCTDRPVCYRKGFSGSRRNGYRDIIWDTGSTPRNDGRLSCRTSHSHGFL